MKRANHLLLGLLLAVSLHAQAISQGSVAAGGNGVVSSGANLYGIDIRAFGGRPLFEPQNTITVATDGTSSVSTMGISDFQIGDNIVIPRAGAATSQTTPGAPTLTMIGAKGSKSVSYECVGVDRQWGLTAAGSAATVSTVPSVFGAGPTAISSATWTSDTVTVNTPTNMPFSTGKYHVMIGNITSGGRQIGGIQLATIVSSTQLTYALSGSGTVTVNSGDPSSVIFVNGFVITQASETLGSNQIVLTTDVNHNLQNQLTSTHPTKIFLDGIGFAGENPVGYANGEFSIASATSNTIIVTTQYTATHTENATASSTLATSKVAQMTVLTYPEVLVTCPQDASTGIPSTGGIQYAIYANYGSGYAPIGFTPYNHSIFIDYGPAYTKAEFVPPPSMSLPARPPSSAVPQTFEGQITGIKGNRLALDRKVPQTVAGVTGYHSNGISLQNAANKACERNDGFVNVNFYTVSIPAPSGNYYYVFNAPVDVSGAANHCNRFSFLDAGSITANGTIYSSRGPMDWIKPDTGYNTFPNGYSGGQVQWTGLANPQLADTSNALTVKGMSFTTQSGSQNAVYADQPGSKFENDSFISGSSYPTSTPLFIGGAGFQDSLKDIFFGAIPNPQLPLRPDCGNCGQVMFWPVPAIELAGGPSNLPDLWWTGTNYGNGTGLQIDMTYPGPVEGLGALEILNVQTFQEPWQPFIQVLGASQMAYMHLERIQMDSITLPVVGMTSSTGCTGVIIANQLAAAGSTSPVYTGYPCRFIVETEDFATSYPMQNTNEQFTIPLIGVIQYGAFTTSIEKTTSQCFSAASPAVCGSNIDGFVTIAASASTVVVNTTAVTAKSTVSLTFDVTQGANLGVTCNTAAQQPYVSARTAGKSFTISVPSAFATNPGCIGFHLKN
jgi:hypothetical protein